MELRRYRSNFLPPYQPTVRRKVFLSYDSRDQSLMEDFINRWTERDHVFLPRFIGCFDEGIINSGDCNYVMGRIRREYVADSTVTLVFVGTCTHGRRYIDWELKASLRRGETYLPNGLLAIAIPGYTSLHLPGRLLLNVDSGYANFYSYPRSAHELAAWIERAYQASIDQTHLIVNPGEPWRNNRCCSACGVTH